RELARRRALRIDVQRVERLARRHEQPVALRSAESDVRAALGQPNASEQRRRRVPDRDAAVADSAARVARAPEVAEHVDAYAVGAAWDAVDRERCELLDVGHAAVRADVADVQVAARYDVELLVVGR